MDETVTIILVLGSLIVMVLMMIVEFLKLFIKKIKWKFNITLFVVMFLVFILAILLAPGHMRARASGQLTACESNIKNIGTALEMYAEDIGGLYPHDLSTLSPQYLKQLPRCPSMDEEYGYTVSDDLKIYTVYCSGKNAHDAVGLKTGFPQYSSEKGLITE